MPSRQYRPHARTGRRRARDAHGRPFYAHIHCGSAAIVAALRTSEHLPARYRIEAVGYGAGKRPYEGCSGTLRCLLVHADA